MTLSLASVHPFPEVVGVVQSQDLPLRVRSDSVDCTANLEWSLCLFMWLLYNTGFQIPPA